MLRLILYLYYIAVAGVIAATAQEYPNRPIHVISPPAGSPVDFTARMFAQGVSGPLGQPIVVENRLPGVIQGQAIINAPADGYTLLCATNLFILGSLMVKTPYDPVTDFSPIVLAATAPNVLVVTVSLPVRSVTELITLAKARPGELNYATTPAGSSDLGGELFMAITGAKLASIPYANVSQKVADVISGQMQIGILPVSIVKPLVKSGRLKGLAVTSLQRSVLFPELPTVAASGAPGFESVSIYGLLARAKTPVGIINRLNQETVRFLRVAETKEAFLKAGLEVVGSSPEEFGGKIKSEIVKWGKVINDAGIKIN